MYFCLLLIQLLSVLLVVLLHFLIILLLRFLVLLHQILYMTPPAQTHLLLLLTDILPHLANLLGNLCDRIVYCKSGSERIPGCADLISARFA